MNSFYFGCLVLSALFIFIKELRCMEINKQINNTKKKRKINSKTNKRKQVNKNHKTARRAHTHIYTEYVCITLYLKSKMIENDHD